MAICRLAAPAALVVVLASFEASAQPASAPVGAPPPAASSAPPAGGPAPVGAPPPSASSAPPATGPGYAPPRWVSGPSGYDAPPPGGPPPAPVAGPPRPRSIEEFKQLRKDLREALHDAEDDDRDRDAERIRRDLEDVDAWYREDTARRSGGAMAGGIVMISVGGLGIVVGGLTLAFAGIGDSLGGSSNDGAKAAGLTGLIAGAGLVGGGIPLMIYGSKRVMAADAAIGPRAPSREGAAAIVVGPGSLRLEGSF